MNSACKEACGNKLDILLLNDILPEIRISNTSSLLRNFLFFLKPRPAMLMRDWVHIIHKPFQRQLKISKQITNRESQSLDKYTE